MSTRAIGCDFALIFRSAAFQIEVKDASECHKYVPGLGYELGQQHRHRLREPCAPANSYDSCAAPHVSHMPWDH